MLIAGSSRLDYSSPQKLLIETHIDHMNRFLRQIRFLELILRARCFWYTYLARVIFESWMCYVKAFLMLNAILVFSFLILTVYFKNHCMSIIWQEPHNMLILDQCLARLVLFTKWTVYFKFLWPLWYFITSYFPI